MKDWFVYILECKDGTLYTGITDDLEKRIATHNSGKGAKYTKGRGPVRMMYSEKYLGRSEASKREGEIKKLNRSAKMKLFQTRVQ